MDLSKAVAALALMLAGVLIGGYSRAAEPDTRTAREAARQVALAEHQRRKEDFARLCAKRLMSTAEMEACRAAYRRL